MWFRPAFTADEYNSTIHLSPAPDTAAASTSANRPTEKIAVVAPTHSASVTHVVAVIPLGLPQEPDGLSKIRQRTGHDAGSDDAEAGCDDVTGEDPDSMEKLATGW